MSSGTVAAAAMPTVPPCGVCGQGIQSVRIRGRDAKVLAEGGQQNTRIKTARHVTPPRM